VARILRSDISDAGVLASISKETRAVTTLTRTQTAPGATKVVIIGAGFGGLEAARALANVPVEVTVVDRQNHHCFQPLLYQVATAALSPAEIAWPIRALLRDQTNASVVLASVTGIDLDASLVHTDVRSLPYDFLIVATGATHSYFGHPEWERFAPGLKRLEDATKIRSRVLLAFEHAELADDLKVRERLLTFVVIGGGPTGVEMAGAIAEIARETLRSDFRRVDPRESRIILLEAAGRLLASFPERLARYAEMTLADMGVEVLTSNLVTACDANGVTTDKQRIEAATLIWAAGVIASPAATWLGAPHDRAGRVRVEPDLTVAGHPNIFVIGDAAAATDRDTKPIPGIAPAAKQMGDYAGKTIAAFVRGRRKPGPFRYRHYGELATIGRRSAIVKLSRFQLAGFGGWLFWSVAHIYFLIGARNRVVVAFSWLWSYLTFQRGARLITTS
jgi:NADH dehydrogenase